MEKQLHSIKNEHKNLTSGVAQSIGGSNQLKLNQPLYDEKIDEKNMLKFLEGKMKEMETEFDVEDNIVIDLGSAFTKIGFSGEDLPRLILPSIYSSLKEDPNKKKDFNLEKNPHLYGYEIYSKEHFAERTDYDIQFLKPGNHEEIIDNNFKNLLEDSFKKENISVNDHNVIINASPVRNKDNIRALTKLFLDDFNFKGLSIINSSSLALFSTGRTSGLVIDCGEINTMCVPIYEGFPLYHALNISRVGGRDISEEIKRGVMEKYPDFEGDNIVNIREIKEKICYVPYIRDAEYYLNNQKEDILKDDQKLYKLPDGEGVDKILEIPKQARINAAEILFK